MIIRTAEGNLVANSVRPAGKYLAVHTDEGIVTLDPQTDENWTDLLCVRSCSDGSFNLTDAIRIDTSTDAG